MIGMKAARRGCVFFNFGDKYALRLVLSVYSLRKHHGGPVTVFLARDAVAEDLARLLARLDVEIRWADGLTKSFDRHRLFLESPYETTLVLDGDLIFLGPIDELWEPLEEHGVLATRFHAPTYGIEGTPERPGWGNRSAFLDNIRSLLDEEVHIEARRRLHEDGIDVNVGVFGISRPKGDGFLADWAGRMERGRPYNIVLLDEMLAFALLWAHPHYLADERWNCPADEFFRRTNLADAQVIHYFADGHLVNGFRLGRNPNSWAGRKWYALYEEAAANLDLDRWRAADPTFAGTLEQALNGGKVFSVAQRFRRLRGKIGRLPARLARAARPGASTA